ncbi:hypothetical protein Salat_2707600 [Sesamum alatum]|uniref:Uncharacterized protein n=1 Tax=Sesamum alatum TaxID=300844 RepID=A0AAE1XQ48_9LAMI|nr:hypothetical protein Salat_2707600 [Sesamum alatum]
MAKLKRFLHFVYRFKRTRKVYRNLKELSKRRLKPDARRPPRRRYICFQAESNMAESYEEESHVVHLYYAVKVVGPSYYERGNQDEEFPEIRPIFVTECEYRRWFGFGSAIYTLGRCCSPAHSDNGSACRESCFQYFRFAGDDSRERSWIGLPPPSRLRCACAAASMDGRLYLFGKSNTRFGFVEVESSDDEEGEIEEDDGDGEEPWLEVFDPVRGSWVAPADQPPLFPDSVSIESPMYAVGWPPRRILLSSLSTDHFPYKFGYNVIDNRWEHVYQESEGVIASVPDDALLVNDDTFYYVSAAHGRLCAYEIEAGACFAAPLENALAAKAEEGGLDLLHIDGDKFCFIWDEIHNTVHKVLHCMKFSVSKVVDTSAREALGLNGSLAITTLSHKSFLVDNFTRRGRANWLEGDWERIEEVAFESPMREMVNVVEPESTETIASMVDEIRRKMRHWG